MRQSIFWSKDEKKVNREDEAYKLNQLLMYGSLEEIQHILEKEGLEKVRNIFILKPTKIYTKAAFNFIKKFILKVDQDLDPEKYVKTLY